MNSPNDSKLYAHIALPVPLIGGFDYIVTKVQTEHAVAGARALVPFGNRRLVGVVLELKTRCDLDDAKLKPIDMIFTEQPVFSSEMLTLLSWAAHYYSHPIGEVFSNALPSALRKPKAAPTYTKSLWRRTRKAFEGRSNAHLQIAALDALEHSPSGLWDDALRIMGFSTNLLRKLEQQDYIEREENDLSSKAMQISEDAHHYTLNEEQAATLTSIKAKLGRFSPHLLEGVTGSGKTEVYIAAVKECLLLDKQALVLVPEINLTPQTFKRFQSQLGIPVAVYHSGMTEKEKFITYQMLKTGQAKVLIGTRSAIFLSTQALGLIIVDEEHDSSYKQSDNFKYSARDLAVKRAQLEDCAIVLGSATPSSDSLLNAQQGRFDWLTLNQRAKKAAMPTIKLEDMRALTSKDILSPRTLAKIKTQIDQGNQVIVFHNRRGLAPSLMCFDCGWIYQCPNCDARATVHQRPARLHCHHCDYKSPIVGSCPQCKGTNVNAVGAGTERIEQILHYYFPNTDLVRLDRDEIKNQADLEQATSIIHQGQPCLIVGTQMIVKGHDFPDVTLVVVVDADGLFFSSDFRAMEKGAQQLLQVAGRAGRGDKKGEVTIQTRQPEHPLFELLKQHQYTNFMQNELRERELCALPPFSKLATIRAESVDAGRCEQALAQLKGCLNSTKELAGICIAGPLSAAISRKQNRYRYYLHVFAENNKQRFIAQHYTLHFIHQLKQRDLRLSIDVDPIETN
ncbi:hypothetical protein A3750_10740 [Oleiphilus sp. HI0079]|uniref:primosomal protein N' n=1 Tax=Oleiphilus sp. HI0079 TaxID=1822254 RepID=UPI0007C24FD0|nr:primosomal protein N' [Oleiphilus sp. HI0079]KZZ16092.1 hypothetical protein A3750_10740 [Oleiphilus sp. HI0079]KZZ81406.1 hypothetical protein A3767_07200 [Oleiphilus sp. HI0133]